MDIQQQALKTYQNNLVYFEKNHKSIYEKITLLDTLIEDGTYQEHYTLEYKDEGYFDVQELSSGEFLYKINSIQHAENMKLLTNKKRTGGIFKALKYVSANDEQAEEIDKSQLCFHNALWATIKPINYVVKLTPPDSFMKQVNKVIFIDIGLGIHLKGIIEKLQARVIFIKEKNFETFRLSLFTCNYKELSENRHIHFSISENEVVEQKKFIAFLNDGINYNLYIKHIPFSDEYTKVLQTFQRYVLSQSFINYGYSAILLRYIDSPKYLVKGYNFLNISQKYEDNIFSKKPVLLLFSGPSTNHNIDWVKKYHEKFIIVTALSTCKLLYKENIKPDIVIHADPGEATAKLFEGIDTDTYFKDTTIILSSNVNENTVEKLKSGNISFIEQGSKYKKGFGILTAPTVGEYSYALSLILGASKIYLLGINLALDKVTLKSHADFHFGQLQGSENNNSASLDPDEDIQYVKGNFDEKIPTFASYFLSIDQFEYFSKVLKHETQKVYNLSDGAYLAGAEPLHIEEYNWDDLRQIDKTELHSTLYDFFQKIGSAEFRDEDKEIITYQLQEAKKLKKVILKHQKKQYKDVGNYLNAISALIFELSDMDYKTNSDLAQVYYEYFQIMQSYVYDLFNTQGLENPNKHIIEIDKLLMKQLLKIADTYIKAMERYLTKE